jgi:hypothetical protein
MIVLATPRQLHRHPMMCHPMLHHPMLHYPMLHRHPMLHRPWSTLIRSQERIDKQQLQN